MILQQPAGLLFSLTLTDRKRISLVDRSSCKCRYLTNYRMHSIWNISSLSVKGQHPCTHHRHINTNTKHSQMDRHIGCISLPPLRWNTPFLFSHFLDWLAAPELLPGACLQRLSFGFMCRRATGAMEFVATMHVVCTPTSHVVVSVLPVPEIHCGLLFVFNFSLWAEQKYSSDSAQQDSSESGMFRLKIRDKGFLA